jgi:hypothetical protein
MNHRKLLKNTAVVLSPEIARSILGKVRRLEAESVQDLANEMIGARLKFPGNAHMFHALSEQIGELANAYLEGKSLEEIRKEALQVACVAMRIYEEGDADFGDVR